MTRIHPKWRYVYRSAITGKFVTKAFADANPETTVCEGKYLGIR